MRINTLLSAAEAAGYAMAITQEMAAEQDAAMDAAEEGNGWLVVPATDPSTNVMLGADMGRPAWIPDWVAHYWRTSRATA